MVELQHSPVGLRPRVILRVDMTSAVKSARHRRSTRSMALRSTAPAPPSSRFAVWALARLDARSHSATRIDDRTAATISVSPVRTS